MSKRHDVGIGLRIYDCATRDRSPWPQARYAPSTQQTDRPHQPTMITKKDGLKPQMPLGLAIIDIGSKLPLGQMRRPAGILHFLPKAAVERGVVRRLCHSRGSGKTKHQRGSEDAGEPANSHRDLLGISFEAKGPPVPLVRSSLNF